MCVCNTQAQLVPGQIPTATMSYEEDDSEQYYDYTLATNFER